MLLLMKYEFKKLKSTILFILGITVFLETIFIMGTFGSLSIAAVVTIIPILLFMTVSTIYIACRCIYSLYLDMNEDSGMLTFMVPQNIRKILVAKLLSSFVLLIFFNLLFLPLTLINIFILLNKVEEGSNVLSILLKFIDIIADTEGVSLFVYSGFVFIMYSICYTFFFILCGFLAVMLTRNIMISSNALKVILTFIIWGILSRPIEILLSFIAENAPYQMNDILFPKAFPKLNSSSGISNVNLNHVLEQINDSSSFFNTDAAYAVLTMFLAFALFYAFLSAVIFIVVSRMLERKPEI